MATTAYVPWFDAVKSFDLHSMSEVLTTTPSVTMFLTTETLKDLDHVFGSSDNCRMNALQWCLWHSSGAEDSVKRQAVISWLIQRSTPSELNDHRWANGNTSLHIAAYKNEIDIVQVMLDHGALPHLTNGLNFTASDMTTQEDIRSILREATSKVLAHSKSLDGALFSRENVYTSAVNQSPLVADANISHGHEALLATQTPLLRSILRTTPNNNADSSSVVRKDSQKRNVTFNESAEIRQYIELSSDEEILPKRRRRGFFMMMNYDDASEEEEEEDELTEEDMLEDGMEVKIADPSDELDILARLQQEMNAFEDYQNPSNYDWDQFVEEENDEDQDELYQDSVVTELSPTTKRMDLEEEVPEMQISAEDLLLLQTGHSESVDSLLKELISAPVDESEVALAESVEGQAKPVDEDQLQREDDIKENVFSSESAPSEEEIENVQEVPILSEQADKQEADGNEVQEALQSAEIDMYHQEEPLKLSCEEYVSMPVEEPCLDEDTASLADNADVLRVINEDILPSSVISNNDAEDNNVLLQSMHESTSSIANKALPSSPVLVEAQSDTSDQESTSLDTQPIKVLSSDSLPSDKSFVSSSCDEEDMEEHTHRTQALGAQRERWESDIMSPIDNESPMSFAAIFAAHQKKPQPELRIQPTTYIDLALAQEKALKGSLTDGESSSSLSTDISVKPLPAVPSSGEHFTAKRLSGIFQRLSDKKRISPAMNGLKQISMSNLKRLSFEQALLRKSSQSAHADKVQNDVTQSATDNTATANGDTTNLLSRSVTNAARLSKYFAKNRKVSIDSETSDSSNVLENDSQSSGSQYDTPPSSPSPTGSFEDEQKRLSAAASQKSSIRRRQSMPSFTSTSTPLKSATRYENMSSEKLSSSPVSQNAFYGDASKRHSYGSDTDLASKRFTLDVADRNHAIAFASTMQESLERISVGQKPKMYTEKYQQDIVHLSSPKDYSPKREGSVSPSWKAAREQQKGGTFTKSRQRSHSTKAPKDIPGKLYVRLVAVQDINVPVPSEPTYVRCILNDGTYEHLSKYVMLGRHMQFDQEFKISANSNLDFSLSLHVRPDSHVKPKAPITRLLNSHKKVAPELSQFVNRQDGAIGSTRISFKDMIEECRSKLCSATFPSQNDWAIDVSRTIDKLESTKVKPKTVGKLLLHMVYIPGSKDRHMKYPRDIDECMRGFDARRWHENEWRTGYMSQMGGDVNFWRRRYYKAVGARLLAYHDTHLAPRAAIDLTQAVRLTSNGRLILGTPQSPDQTNRHEMSEEDCVKNSFQFTFSNGEKIDFFCDTERERDVWVNTLRAAIGSMPQWPEWLVDGKDDIII
ncbi:hypothetical protein INT44_001685 [Umbelopsis vinacea]|uniref:PH domain-containing protein n=1 Tax=Umbelopsis vinacea TaxID=44442 RepID=A0A8H7PQR3_9FUNG|nr:hypothetical protein INT44_001685 [Umbelopsis vinacea]